MANIFLILILNCNTLYRMKAIFSNIISILVYCIVEYVISCNCAPYKNSEDGIGVCDCSLVLIFNDLYIFDIGSK